MRVLVFGASVAQGYWDSQGGWADRLKHYYDAKQLQDFSIDLPAVMNLGVSGNTSAQILERIDFEAGARQNDKGLTIIVQVGGNNAAETKGRTITSIEQYQVELKQIIKKAQNFTNKIIVVGLQAVDETKTNPIPWADLYFKNINMSKFEKAAESSCWEDGVKFVPVNEKFLREMNNGRELLSHDGLHPNDDGHLLIFELVRPVLDEILNT